MNTHRHLTTLVIALVALIATATASAQQVRRAPVEVSPRAVRLIEADPDLGLIVGADEESSANLMYLFGLQDSSAFRRVQLGPRLAKPAFGDGVRFPDLHSDGWLLLYSGRLTENRTATMLSKMSRDLVAPTVEWSRRVHWEGGDLGGLRLTATYQESPRATSRSGAELIGFLGADATVDDVPACTELELGAAPEGLATNGSPQAGRARAPGKNRVLLARFGYFGEIEEGWLLGHEACPTGTDEDYLSELLTMESGRVVATGVNCWRRPYVLALERDATGGFAGSEHAYRLPIANQDFEPVSAAAELDGDLVIAGTRAVSGGERLWVARLDGGSFDVVLAREIDLPPSNVSFATWIQHLALTPQGKVRAVLGPNHGTHPSHSWALRYDLDLDPAAPSLVVDASRIDYDQSPDDANPNGPEDHHEIDVAGWADFGQGELWAGAVNTEFFFPCPPPPGDPVELAAATAVSPDPLCGQFLHEPVLLMPNSTAWGHGALPAPVVHNLVLQHQVTTGPPPINNPYADPVRGFQALDNEELCTVQRPEERLEVIHATALSYRP